MTQPSDNTYSIRMTLMNTMGKNLKMETPPTWCIEIFRGKIDDTSKPENEYWNILEETGRDFLNAIQKEQKESQIKVTGGEIIGLHDQIEKAYPFPFSGSTLKDAWIGEGDEKYAVVVLQEWTAKNVPEAVIEPLQTELKPYKFASVDANGVADVVGVVGGVKEAIHEEQLRVFGSSGEFVTEGEALETLHTRLEEDHAAWLKELQDNYPTRNSKIELLIDYIDKLISDIFTHADAVLEILKIFSLNTSDLVSYKDQLKNILTENESLSSEKEKIEKVRFFFKTLKTYLEQTKIPDGYGDDGLSGNMPSMGI